MLTVNGMTTFINNGNNIAIQADPSHTMNKTLAITVEALAGKDFWNFTSD